MRSRNIKSGFFTNSQLVQCEPLARILFEGLWCVADREGRLKDDSFSLKMKILPADNCDVNLLLNQLHDNDLILRYEVDGKKYIWVKEFSKHQKPHTKESNSIIPSPDNILKKKRKSAPTQIGASPSLGNGEHALNPESLILNPESLPNGNSAREGKISLEGLSVDHNRDWLAEKRSQGRYLFHDEVFILEYFKNYCRSKVKKYANYLAAYRNAFEWSNCQPKSISGLAVEAKNREEILRIETSKPDYIEKLMRYKSKGIPLSVDQEEQLVRATA